jgi:hypothetical protein
MFVRHQWFGNPIPLTDHEKVPFQAKRFVTSWAFGTLTQKFWLKPGVWYSPPHILCDSSILLSPDQADHSVSKSHPGANLTCRSLANGRLVSIIERTGKNSWSIIADSSGEKSIFLSLWFQLIFLFIARTVDIQSHICQYNFLTRAGNFSQIGRALRRNPWSFQNPQIRVSRTLSALSCFTTPRFDRHSLIFDGLIVFFSRSRSNPVTMNNSPPHLHQCENLTSLATPKSETAARWSVTSLALFFSGLFRHNLPFMSCSVWRLILHSASLLIFARIFFF